MKKMFLVLALVVSASLYGDTIDSCSYDIKRDFQNTGYYQWASYMLSIEDEIESLDDYFETFFKKVPFFRRGSLKHSAFWECFNHGKKILGLVPGDYFYMWFGMGNEEDWTCIYIGRYNSDGSITGNFYEHY
ncbi:hypothetical protein AGMMS49587_20230 [Spirochaetia bacterium]|nr:hypothetical protein AGMMS49587_20230 [Spirochaetia bacterium]